MSKLRFQDAVLFEDSDFILINKPPFIATLEDRQDPTNILELAREYEPQAQVCHRLDKDTSGVLAIARNPEAYRHLSMQFENREVTKIYHAVVDGIHNFNDQLVDAPILKQNDGTVKISRSGKDAQTYFTTLQAFKAHTLVECKPVTGRMHQIRIHLARLGASITGDTLYGGKPFFVSAIKRGFNLKKMTDEEPLVKRMALHARSLRFLLVKGDGCSIEAPYPKDFQALIRQLSGHKR
ncbi:MAG: RNA pseudouridine synthase [Cyclobacteriaceae bacterium]|nr:RNA pseudouridine synthase [Cyclobacteriaceae bacterium]